MQSEGDKYSRVRTVCLVVIATLAVVTALYFGRPFFVPIAMAVMLNAVFRPVVRAMERVRIPSWAGATIVVLALMAVMAAAGVALEKPVQRWLAKLPETFDAARTKLERVIRPVQ